MMSRGNAAWLAVAALGAMVSIPAQAAGFLDDFARVFLGRQTPPPAVIEPFDPLSVTVKPKRQRGPEVSSKPAPPLVKLDPSSEPDWYLRDPTLRRGDIVVTDKGVLVYQGRDSDAMRPADFAMFSAGKDGGKGWKQQLQAAAAGGRSFFRDVRPAPPPLTQTAISQESTAPAAIPDALRIMDATTR